MRYFKVILLVFVLWFLVSSSVYADEISELKRQMQKIQEENKTLQEQLNKQRELTERLLKKMEALEDKDEVLSKEVKRLKERPAETVLAKEPELPGLVDIPKLKMKGFADISFKAEEDVNAGEQNPNTFSLGQLDLFITSDLSEEISVLNENIFEFNSENEAVLDVERLELKYALSELFNIKIGRMHTALGFWNTEYHHSAWLHTTAFRPLIYNWEDEDGIIPNHFVGLNVFGKKDFDSFDFEYDLGIANGRGNTQRKIQNIQDRNDSKAFNARFSIAPDSISGLKFGSSIYLDKIPPNTSVASRNGEISELILGGHITYIKDKVELLAEVLHLNHDDEVSKKDYNTLGFYLQGAYQFDKWKPYYRFDFIDFGGGDPYYAPNDIDISKHTLGIRWDPVTWNSIKLEYSYSERDDADDRHSVTVQSAFTF